MGEIKVSVHGTPLFDWNGDEAAVANILKQFPRGARGVGFEPDKFAQACVHYLESLPRRGPGNPVSQEMQMMGVTWLILTRDTGNPDRPGKIGDYVPHTDFAVNIELGETSFRMSVQATTKFEA
jgi:hypothetical protein